MSNRPLLFAIALVLIMPQSWVEAKCFPSKVEKAIEDRFQWVAVRKHGKIQNGRCEATVELLHVPGNSKGKTVAAKRGIAIDGWSKDKEICEAKIGSEMGVTLDSYCCDEAPCQKGRKNEIQFSLTRLESEKTSQRTE